MKTAEINPLTKQVDIQLFDLCERKCRKKRNKLEDFRIA